MTLEERIAEAIRDVADNGAHGGDYWLNLARAVVAVLPAADVDTVAAVAKAIREGATGYPEHPARAAIATLEARGWHAHDAGVRHLVPVDESADGDIGPISGLTHRESDDFMEAIVAPTADVSDADVQAALHEWDRGREEWQPELGLSADHWGMRAVLAWRGAPTYRSDVSDAQIREAASEIWDKEDAYEVVHRLLDAQAAAHAAEVEALREKYGALQDHAFTVAQDATRAEAEVEALRAERDNARRVNDLEAELSNPNSPAFIPTEYVRFLMNNVKNAEADRDAYRARIDAVRALCEPWLADLSPTAMPRPSGGIQLAGLIRAALDGA